MKMIPIVHRLRGIICTLVSIGSGALLNGATLNCDLSQYRPLPGLEARTENNTLVVRWDGTPGQRLRAQFGISNGVLLSVPRFDDWSAINRALRVGEFFMTTGEVLIKKCALEGRGRRREIVADVEWTFPLEFVEVVWGDGEKVGRETIAATDQPPFGARRFRIPFDGAGKKWVRFSAWDSAGNGAFTQPVHLR